MKSVEAMNIDHRSRRILCFLCLNKFARLYIHNHYLSMNACLPASVSSSVINSSVSSIPTEIAAAILHLLEDLSISEVVPSRNLSKVLSFSRHVLP